MTSTLSTRVLLLIAIGIAVNMALGQIAQAIKLPIFLDRSGPWLSLSWRGLGLAF
ncbi:hypothetical protein QWZ10_22255 [Paracoccus cavernae]|uniref:MFS transporter n=1 Tax=Paracoccus cavernae TaxID=1571207 RepID=A0ABT8DFB0_9RHOB|nr:hypothetical protein [Paracoccus cavernae]